MAGALSDNSLDGSPQTAPAQRRTIDTALLTPPFEWTYFEFSLYVPEVGLSLLESPSLAPPCSLFDYNEIPPIDDLWWTEAFDTALLSPPMEAFSPSSAVEIPSYLSQGGLSSLEIPSLTSSSFPFSFSPGLVSEGASPHSPPDGRRSSVGPPDYIAREGLLEQGYPGDTPIALQRREILRRIIFNETAQCPTTGRDIKRLANVQKYTADAADGAFLSSGKKPGSFALQCAWAGCDHLSGHPDRLKTHIFTHIGFKPFPCDRTCGDSNW